MAREEDGQKLRDTTLAELAAVVDELEVADGVRRRTVQEAIGLAEGDDDMDSIVRRQGHGEDIQLLRDVGHHLVVADGMTAFLELNEDRGLLVHGSPLVIALTTLGELLWDRSIPLHAGGSPRERAWRLSDEDRSLLKLLAAGLKDEAIARHLGIGLRTVVRRVGKLARVLDADTRSKLGCKPPAACCDVRGATTWAWLSSLKRITRSSARSLGHLACRRPRFCCALREPWCRRSTSRSGPS